MDLDLFNTIASMGLGAVIAVLVLYWKRGDDKRYSDTLQAYTNESNKRLDMMIAAFQANTEALNALRETWSAKEIIEEFEKRVLETLARAQETEEL